MDSILIVPIKVACIDMGMQPVLYIMWIEKSYLTQLFSNYHFGLIIHNAKVLLSEELKRTLCYILNCEQCISHLHLVEISRPGT